MSSFGVGTVCPLLFLVWAWRKTEDRHFGSPGPISRRSQATHVLSSLSRSKQINLLTKRVLESVFFVRVPVLGGFKGEPKGFESHHFVGPI